MRQLLKSLVVGSVAISAQNALAGGLPESGSSSSAATISANTGSFASSVTKSAASTGSASSTASGSSGSAGASSAQNSGAGFIAIEDDPLIVDASAIMDDDGMGNVQVQWQVSSDG